MGNLQSGACSQKLCLPSKTNETLKGDNLVKPTQRSHEAKITLFHACRCHKRKKGKKSVLSNALQFRNILHTRITSHRSLSDNYILLNEVIGTGMSGAVVKAKRIDDGEIFAVKTLSFKNVPLAKTKLVLNEAIVYLQVDHPNIAKLFEIYEEKDTLRLVMEYCKGKELYEHLSQKKRYSERDAINVTRQMLESINYCHQHNVCHRDLKLENWVYQDTSPDSPLKLIDFGFSHIFHPNVPMTAIHGTVYYVSPEVMLGKYNEMCDLWSIGVIVYMLLSGTPPFDGKNDREILCNIKKGVYVLNGPRWNGISSFAKDFIRLLLRNRPSQRPSAQEALRHKWLNQNEEDDDVEIDIEVLKSMTEFAALSAIKRAALVLIALSISTNEVRDLEKIFRVIDQQGMGSIRVDDLVRVLKEHLNLPTSDAEKVFSRIDQTGNSQIHYSEFLASTLQMKLILDEDMIRGAFEKLDYDNTGHISLDNLRQTLGDRYDSKVEDILNECDIKKNGVIDYDEFLWTILHDGIPDFDTFVSNSDFEKEY